MSTIPKFEVISADMDDPSSEQTHFFRQLSHQVGQWSVYNFGNQLAHRPAMGMLEELNELQEGLVALSRGSALDAVGDVTIYMADYFAKRGWDMGEAWHLKTPPAMSVDNLTQLPSILTRKLAHAHLKGEQGIRGGAEKHDAAMQATCGTTLWYLSMVCRFLHRDYLEVVSDVWMEVSKRDWVLNKNTAHTVAAAVVADAIATGIEGNPSYEVGNDEDEE